MSERDDLPHGDDAVPPAAAGPITTDSHGPHDPGATVPDVTLAAPTDGAATEPIFAWTPDLAAGRGPGTTAGPAESPARRHPVLDGAIWVVSLVLATMLAIGAANLSRPTTSTTGFEQGREQGQVIGSVLVALFVAFAIWAVVVWLSRRRGRARRLTSPIVPLIAIVILLGGLGRSASRIEAAGPSGPSPAPTGPSQAPSGPSASPRTVADVLSIGTPYHFERSPAAEEQQMIAQFNGGTTAFKDVQVRRVYSGPDLAGFALVADATIAPGNEAVAMAAVELGLGTENVTKTHMTLAGHDAISGVAGGAGYVIWIEAPFLKVVFAQTEQAAKDISGAFASG